MLPSLHPYCQLQAFTTYGLDYFKQPLNYCPRVVIPNYHKVNALKKQNPQIYYLLDLEVGRPKWCHGAKSQGTRGVEVLGESLFPHLVSRGPLLSLARGAVARLHYQQCGLLSLARGAVARLHYQQCGLLSLARGAVARLHYQQCGLRSLAFLSPSDYTGPV